MHIYRTSFPKILLRSLIGSLLFVITTACSSAIPNSQPAPQQPAPVTKYIGTFSVIPGTIYLRAPISASQAGTAGFSLSSSGYTPDSTHNYIYLNTETEQTLQLLPDNTAVIIENVHLPVRPNDETAAWTIRWFLYSIVKSDTNNDNRLNSNDAKTLAISDAGGQGYTELIQDVVEVHGQTLRDPETLVIIYRKEGKLFLSRIDLPQRVIDRTIELPSFGPDVLLNAN